MHISRLDAIYQEQRQAQERKDAEGQPAEDATQRKRIPERFPVGAVLPALPRAVQLLAFRRRMTDRTAAQRPMMP